jgi:hypothetical protein
LHIYCEAEDIPRGCFVVLEKKLRIKEPKVRLQVIKDDMPEDLKEIIFDNIDKELHNIAERKFQKKTSPKDCWLFGKPCMFYNLCWKGDSSGLQKR